MTLKLLDDYQYLQDATNTTIITPTTIKEVLND